MKPMYGFFLICSGKAHHQQKMDKETMNTEHYWGFFSLKMKTKITYLKLHGEKQIKSIIICILNSLMEGVYFFNM